MAIFTVILMLCADLCATAYEDMEMKATFYIATNGDDEWSGTLPDPNSDRTDGPFATLERARDEIRKRGGSLPDGGVTVYVRGGIYPLTKAFELTEQDSGTQKTPIVYRAYEDEEVRLIGGAEITGFEPIDDPAILSRIDKAYHDRILQIDLRASGITDFGEMTPRGFGRRVHPAGLELFFQDKPMQLSRWPNDDWVTIADVPAGKDGGKFTYKGDRPKRWSKADDAWVHGYWTQEWADSYVKVKSIDAQTREIITQEPHGVYGYTAGKRYYALNILEELDEPGEWYLDRKTGVLYFWPPASISEGRAFVSIIHTLVSMKDVSHVTLRGFKMELCRGTAVVMDGGDHNAIAGCTLRNIGNAAVSISGGTYNGVIGCDIYETGDGGIKLSGGDRKALTPGHNFAENNHIYHYSRWSRTYRPAVMISGVGNRLAHNLIHDAPHMGVAFSGNEHIIEFNEVYNLCYETGDVGTFYIGRDWTMRGNMVRHNFFHHIRGPYGYGANAVYLDDWASGTTIFGNVFYEAGRAAFIGGGRNNVVENNIFVDCQPAVHIDARGLGWAKYYFDGSNTTLTDRMKAMNYKEPPYSVRYPELLTLYDDDPAVPKYNKIIRNVRVGGKWMNLQGVDKEIVTIEGNFTEGDPGFVDPENMNFQLKDDSPVYDLGFQRVPIEKIGLYNDELRASWPASE